MSLTDDICRCHDERCVERLTCRRWLERADLGERTVHSDSLYAPRRQPSSAPDDALRGTHPDGGRTMSEPLTDLIEVGAVLALKIQGLIDDHADSGGDEPIGLMALIACWDDARARLEAAIDPLPSHQEPAP